MVGTTLRDDQDLARLISQARKSFEGGAREQAESRILEAVAQYGRRGDLLGELAAMASWRGDLQGALRLYEEAAAVSPPDIGDGFRWEAGARSFALRQYERGREHLERCREVWPENGEVHALLGGCYHGMNRRAEAEDSLRTALHLDGRNPDARALMRDLYYMQGRDSEVRPFLEQYVALAPELAASHGLLANHTCFAEGDPRGSLDHYKRALRITRNRWNRKLNPMYYATLRYPESLVWEFVGALADCGQPAQAEREAFRRLRGAELMACRAHLAKKAGDLHRALELAADAVEMQPDVPPWRAYLGYLQILGGDTPAAEASLRRSVDSESELRATPVDPLVGLAFVTEAMGRRAEAEQMFERAQQASAHQAWHAHAQLMLDLGLWERASEGARTVLGLDPRSPQALAILADAERERGNLREASATLQRLVELQPRNARAWLKLAGVLREMGETAAADAAIRTAVRTGNAPKGWEAAHAGREGKG